MKQRNTPQSLNPTPIIWTSYGLFVLLIADEILMASTLLHRQLPFDYRQRLTLLLAWLIASTILPPLLGYIAGYLSTSKSIGQCARQLDGISYGLFASLLATGLTLLWLNLPFPLPHPSWLPLHVAQFSHFIIAILIIIALAVVYAHRKKKTLPLATYKPFVLLFAGTYLAVTALSIASLVSHLGMMQNIPSATGQLWTEALGALLLLLILIASWFYTTPTVAVTTRIAHTTLLAALYSLIINAVSPPITYALKDSSIAMQFQLATAISLAVWLAVATLSRRRSTTK